MKSTSSPLCRPAPTSSNTSTCSKPPTTFILSMSTAMEALLTSCSKKKEPFHRSVLYFSSSRLWRPLGFFLATTLCIGILSLIISFCIMEALKSQILDSANLLKTPTSLRRPCLALLSTWLPKSSKAKYIQSKQIFGR